MGALRRDEDGARAIRRRCRRRPPRGRAAARRGHVTSVSGRDSRGRVRLRRGAACGGRTARSFRVDVSALEGSCAR